MELIYEVVKISPMDSDLIDYNIFVFKIVLPEQITIENSKILSMNLQVLIDGGAKKMLVDMRNLETIDSAGIGVLINTAKTLRAREGDMYFSNVSVDIKNIFKVINLQNFIELFNTDAEAINQFRYL